MKDNRKTTVRRRCIFRPETIIVIGKKRAESENIIHIRINKKTTDNYSGNYGYMEGTIDSDTGTYVIIDSVCRLCYHVHSHRKKDKVDQDVTLDYFETVRRDDGATCGDTGRLDHVIPNHRVQGLTVSETRTTISPRLHVHRTINLNDRGIRNPLSLHFDVKRIVTPTVV